MESLQLIDQLRSTLYFGKFKYKVVAEIPDAWVTRYAEYWHIDKIDSYIDKRLSGPFKPAKSTNAKKLKKFARWRHKTLQFKNNKEYRTSTSKNEFILYSNSLDAIDPVTKFAENSTIFEAKLIDPANEKCVMYFKRPPRFKYRTYFDFRKSYKNQEAMNQFVDYMKSLPVTYGPDKIKVCPSFFREKHNQWLGYNCSFWLDYNDPGFSTVLRLMGPLWIRKDYQLLQFPKKSEQISLFESEKTA